MTDRDHFAAAALTGLLARGLLQSDLLATDAYKVADAMLRERSRSGQNATDGDETDVKCPERGSHIADFMLRERTNLDAAPAARASVESVVPQPTTHGDSDRTDKAAPRPSEGTGDTPKPINDCVSDRPQPINGPDPDSRVWETPVHTPAPHATPGEGSVPREGAEPVAWAVAGDHGDYAVALFTDKASAQTEADRRALVGLRPGYVVVPLYRQPPCQGLSRKNLTLTETEAETLRELRDEAAQYADEIGLTSSEIRARQRIIDGLLERLGGGR